MNTISYIGLGANLGRVKHTLHTAANTSATLPGTRLHARSSLYQTLAWGNSEQPDFLNAVIMIETDLTAPELLHALSKIEHHHGRNRNNEQRWGPRTLDLDILLYGDDVIDLPNLHIPHPHLHQRAFALIPLLEIAPAIKIPGIGPAREALAMLPSAAPPTILNWSVSP